MESTCELSGLSCIRARAASLGRAEEQEELCKPCEARVHGRCSEAALDVYADDRSTCETKADRPDGVRAYDDKPVEPLWRLRHGDAKNRKARR